MLSEIGAAKYGMPLRPVLVGDDQGVANGAVTTGSSHVTRYGASNPALWLLGIGAVTIGLVAFSTNVRVGSFRASVSGG